MRCLSLADALRARGASCMFLCREHPGHLQNLIAGRGYDAVLLPYRAGDAVQASAPAPAPAHAHWLGTDWATDAADTAAALNDGMVDWIVVDHYALDSRWEQAARAWCRRLMVIDDLADRAHDCDLLLDQNLGRAAFDYRDLVPSGASMLIGTEFALLRPQFAEARCASLGRRSDPKLKRILITMGGVDRDNVTDQVLQALERCTLPAGLEIVVVMGPNAPWLAQVRDHAARADLDVKVLVGVDDMASLMADCDLAIGAAGGTAWERCCLGLPSIVLVLAENQMAGAAALQKAGAALVVRDAADIEKVFERAGDSMPRLLAQLGKAAAYLTDGNGADLVAKKLFKDYG
jgi:UDP-2,4-diacetamido-2,4,6-trideoxy-beta-L-altropyranose hydrolase